MSEFYLGIDVGFGGRRPTTGLCLIIVDEGQLHPTFCNTTSDDSRRLEDLRDLIPAGSTLSGIGIDGPLAQGLRLVNHYRPAEALLSRGLFQKRCKPGQTSAPIGQKLHCHAIRMANLILKLQEEEHLALTTACHPDAIHQSCIIEAFPNAFLAFLLSSEDFPSAIPRGSKSDRYWEIAVRKRYLHDLIGRLAPGRQPGRPLEDIVNHDHRAAFVCALSVVCVATNEYIAVGDPEYGDIVLPPTGVWRADARGSVGWVQQTLRANLAGVCRDNRQNFKRARVTRNGRQWMPEQ